MNHNIILSQHSKRITFLSILFVAVVTSLFVYKKSLWPLLSRSGFQSVSLFEYVSTDQNTHQSLSIVRGQAIQKNPVGQLFLSTKDKAWIGVPFLADKKSIVNLYLNTWSVEIARVEVQLIDATEQREYLIARDSSIRNQTFNLSGFIKNGHTYWVRIYPKTFDPNGMILVESIHLSSIPEIPSFPRIDLIFLICFLLVMFLSQREKTNQVWIVGTGLIVLSFSMRWSALGSTITFPLNGDGQDFFRLTQGFSWLSPFQTAFREPFFIWVQSIFGSLLGLTEFHFRIGSLLLSVALVGVLFVWLQRLTNNLWISGSGGLMMSLGHFFVFNGIRGERVELFVLMGLIFLILIQEKKRSLRYEFILGCVSALFSLTWLIGFIISSFIYGIKAFQDKVSYKNLLVYVIPLILFIGPHLMSQKKTYNDPLHSLNVHTNFYKNAKDTGTPSYGGEKTGLFSYILKEHGVGKLVWDTIKGYATLFFNPLSQMNRIFLGFHYTQFWSFILFPFLVIGILFSLWKRDLWIFVTLFCFLNISVAFLNQIRDPRLFLHAAPFFCFFLGTGIDKVRVEINKLRARAK